MRQEIEALEAEIARDLAKLERAVRQREQLSETIPHLGFRTVSIGIDLRFSIHSLSDNISRNKHLLVNAKRRSEFKRD
jgi:hypothetical protein